MARQSFIASFQHAFEGVFSMFAHERNFRVDIFGALLALLACVITRLRGPELAVIIVCIGLVLALETMNSALEAAVDLATLEYHPLAKKAKDAAAGAVLIAALMSVAVACVIFIPRLVMLATGELRVTEGLLPLAALFLALIVAFAGWCFAHPLTDADDEAVVHELGEER